MKSETNLAHKWLQICAIWVTDFFGAPENAGVEN